MWSLTGLQLEISTLSSPLWQPGGWQRCWERGTTAADAILSLGSCSGGGWAGRTYCW